MAICLGVMLIDVTLSISFTWKPYFSQMMRPFIAACFMKNVRTNAVVMFKDLRNSMTVLICIMVYVLVFSHIGHFVFR